ncbi:phosphatase PAP2 family protein [Desulfovibrio sulfodismutans]|uniref:Phosphatase PAP2 family protein n=1 Tax=Desulfolutivibrio sulfodismutans TaxID=63561 RepID=A0A7K3NHU9_9BACT|nr:phosphatase PAP2 family protein [Desulfolutivibrio sulfodismutans]NDY55760.1 phosphatase PAP2 family protein [Desulfolutivibrio sulfodismutans]QLA13379.1 phosphatase PAP2 family protein [Desulfolutivibrio sulfodismutans DSM 3696]
MKSRLLTQTAKAILAVTGLITLSFLFFDRPAAWFAHGLKQTAVFDLAKYVSLTADETFFFSLLAVGLAASAVNLLGSTPKDWARDLLCICLAVCAAIALTDCLKFVFGRCRPPLLFTEDRYGFTWFTVKSGFTSFPSGHSTRIFALCAALALRFRRLAGPLLLVAAMVGVSRVFALRHYPSDVLAGAFVGVTAACWAWALRRVGPGA